MDADCHCLLQIWTTRLVGLCFDMFSFLVIAVHASSTEEAVAHILQECDGKVIFTTRNLLSTVANALWLCPGKTHTVIYYQEQHRVTEDDGWAESATEDMLKYMGKRLIRFKDIPEHEERRKLCAFFRQSLF